MTNEERDALIAQGWTPPVTVDPDWVEAERLYRDSYGGPYQGQKAGTPFFKAIKRGRALAAAEAKPVMVWVKHDGSAKCPVAISTDVLILYRGGFICMRETGNGKEMWPNVTDYAIITQPEEK